MGCDASSDRFSVLLLSSGELAGQLSGALHAAGAAKVHVALDERAALTELEGARTDLIVCDGDAGWNLVLEVVRRIRAMAHEINSLLPIVVVASDVPVQKAVAARNAGVHRVIDKQLPSARLSEELYELLSHPRPFVRDGGYFGPTRTVFAPPRWSPAEAGARA